MKQKTKTLILWSGLVVLFLALYQLSSPPSRARRGLAELSKDIESQDVASVRIEPSGEQADRVILHVALRGGDGYSTREIALAEAIDIVRDNHLPYSLERAPGTGVGSTLMNLLPMLLLGGLFIYFLRVMKNPAKNPTLQEMVNARIELQPAPQKPQLQGLEEQQRQLLAAIADLRDGRAGPRRVLLSGPAGSGKTALVRWAVAESGVKWLALPGSDVASFFVAMGAARIRRLFEIAAANAPCVLFIDDVDSFAARRGAPGDGDPKAEGQLTEAVQALVELCSILDGVRPFPAGVLFVMATNRSDRLDPALVRPGRVDLTLALPARAESTPHAS